MSNQVNPNEDLDMDEPEGDAYESDAVETYADVARADASMIRALITSRSPPARAANMPASADSRMPDSWSLSADATRALMRPSAAAAM